MILITGATGLSGHFVLLELLRRGFAVRGLAQPIGGPVNVLAGHFVWHDVLSEIIRLSGAACQIVHKPLAVMSEEERASRRFYCQSWRYDDRKLREALALRPSHAWQQTLAETLSREA